MCDVCLQVGKCDPRCPNADDEKSYCLCASCETDIFFGDENVVVDADNNIFCDNECLMDYYGCRYFDWSSEAGEDEDRYEDR